MEITTPSNRRPHILTALLLTIAFAATNAQERDTVYCTGEDREVFNKYVEYMQHKDSLPFDSLLLETATFFLGTPYVGATLEYEPEGLAINLRELDCFTFVENVIALSRTIAAGEPCFDKYCDQLQLMRYREGKITAYTDRLHYTSDWLYVNDQRQTIKYIACETNRTPYTFNLHFMSSHTGSYRQLNADSSLIPAIIEAEQSVSARDSFYAIVPKYEIDTFDVQMQHGDVVCFVTSVPGLDISHVGIITREGEKLTFIHASSIAKQVIVNKESLKEYVESSKSCIGIMTARPLPPIPICNDDQNNSNANFNPTL
jgi:hypothetical protein